MMVVYLFILVFAVLGWLFAGLGGLITGLVVGYCFAYAIGRWSLRRNKGLVPKKTKEAVATYYLKLGEDKLTAIFGDRSATERQAMIMAGVEKLYARSFQDAVAPSTKEWLSKQSLKRAAEEIIKESAHPDKKDFYYELYFAAVMTMYPNVVSEDLDISY